MAASQDTEKASPPPSTTAEATTTTTPTRAATKATTTTKVAIPFDPEHHEEPHPTDIHSVSDGSESHDKHEDDIEAQRDEHDDPTHHVEGNLGGVLSRSQSRASSTRSRPIVIVPRDKRRGLFGRFGLIPEVERPVDYLRSTKWTITLVVAAATAAAPLGSSIFFPALNSIKNDLHADKTVTNLSVALYMLAMAIFPLWWSALSEQFGRRSIYLVSFALFTVFSVLCAVSTNITMLVVFRICSGGASASVQSVGAGTIADLWEPAERGRAMSIYYLGPLLGPLLAPIIGGALAQAFNWRATMWLLAIFGLIIFVMLLFMLPETLLRKPEPEATAAPLTRTTTVESVKKNSKKVVANIKHFVFDPLKVLAFLRFPPVLMTVIIAAIAFGALYIVNVAIQQRYSEEPYHFATIIIGCMYLPSGAGYFISSVFGGPWIDRIMAREARKANRYDEKGKLILLPEDRIRENMWLAITTYPLSLLLFGWTLQHGILWVAPAIGAFIFGLSSMLVFSCSTTMLTEFVRKRSSSGVAVNNFVRNTLSCIGTVVASPWISAWGYGWVFTATCIFCMLVSYTCVILLLRNATKWRKNMDLKLGQM